MTEKDLAVAIMERLAHSDPHSLRKAELLDMRSDVLAMVHGYLVGNTPKASEAVVTKLPKAYELVLGYQGSNNFMADLARSLRTYGRLTERQAEAVLAPPDDRDVAELRSYGIRKPKYRHQAIELIQQARTQNKAMAR